MFALGGVLAFAPVTAAEQRAFFEGYGTSDWHPELMAYFQCVRALRDLVNWTEDALAGNGHRTAERREAMHIVCGILSPSGMVERALGEP